MSTWRCPRLDPQAPTTGRGAVELRREEGRCRLQEPVRTAQPFDLPLELARARPLVGRQARRSVTVHALSLDPAPRGVRDDAELLTDPLAGRVDAEVLRPLHEVQREADRPLTPRITVLPRCSTTPLSRTSHPHEPGTVQLSHDRDAVTAATADCRSKRAAPITAVGRAPVGARSGHRPRRGRPAVPTDP